MNFAKWFDKFLSDKKTMQANSDGTWVVYVSKEDQERQDRNARIEAGTYTEEDLEVIREQMDYAVRHSSASSQYPSGWQYVSGTAVQENDFDPYKHPVMKEALMMRCEYCKTINRAIDVRCSGCGAPL